MRNVFTLFLLVILATFFAGCADGQKQTVNLSTGLDESGNEVAVELDRWGAYSVGKTQEEMTKRSDNDARIAEAEAQKAEAENQTKQVNIEIDSPEEMSAYKDLKMAEAMGAGMEAMGDALVSLAENCGDGKKKDPGIQMPKGAWAEVLEVGVDGLVKVVESPTGLATAVGAAVGTGFKYAGDRTTGDNNTIEKTSSKAGKDSIIQKENAENGLDKEDNDDVQLGYNTDDSGGDSETAEAE